MEVKNLLSTNNIQKFHEAAGQLSPAVAAMFLALPEEVKENTTELRMRVNMPLFVECGGKTLSAQEACKENQLYTNFVAEAEDLAQCFKYLCGHSVHSHEEEIKEGYISLKGGHRAGICGTAVIQNGEIINLRNISSINLRIAKEYKGSADKLMETVFANGLCSVLIIGPPASGKTTILRDLARQLSFYKNTYKKIAVIDERGEIAAVNGGVPGCDVGKTTDVFTAYPKAEGITMAVRTMSPEFIICDEVGTKDECEALLGCMGAGVKIAATIHAGSFNELAARPQGQMLLNQGIFDKAVVLGKTPGKTEEIINLKG